MNVSGKRKSFLEEALFLQAQLIAWWKEFWNQTRNASHLISVVLDLILLTTKVFPPSCLADFGVLMDPQKKRCVMVHHSVAVWAAYALVQLPTVGILSFQLCVQGKLVLSGIALISFYWFSDWQHSSYQAFYKRIWSCSKVLVCARSQAEKSLSSC